MTKGPFPPTDLAKNFYVDFQTPPGSKSKSWQMGDSGPKNIVKSPIGETPSPHSRIGNFWTTH